jgi:transposase
MIHLPASVRVYLCLTPCDMRKSFDSLHALVREHLELDAFAGHLFVFTSRRKDRVKILYWDRDGFAVWSKRLEEGRTRFRLATAVRSAGRKSQRKN